MAIDVGELITNLPEPYAELNFFYRPLKWSLFWHSHDYYQLILVTDGQLDVSFKDEVYCMRKGDFCIIPPHTAHMLYTLKGYTQFGINLNSSFDGRGIVALLYNHINKATRNNRIDIFDSIHEFKKESESLSQLSRLKIAAELDRIVLSTVELIINNKFDFKNKLLNILKREVNSKLMLQDLCREMSLSQTHLERLTHKEFGCGVIELFNQLKINLACTLLSTSDKNIKEISDYLGFCDQAYFCRLFKIKMKMTPKEYSKRCAN